MMRVLVTILAMTLPLAAVPAAAREFDSYSATTRFVMDEYALADTSGSDAEKLRTARYGLGDPIEDDYEAVPNSMRVRWKLNRLKMRVPLNTAGIR